MVLTIWLWGPFSHFFPSLDSGLTMKEKNNSQSRSRENLWYVKSKNLIFLTNNGNSFTSSNFPD